MENNITGGGYGVYLVNTKPINKLQGNKIFFNNLLRNDINIKLDNSRGDFIILNNIEESESGFELRGDARSFAYAYFNYWGDKLGFWFKVVGLSPIYCCPCLHNPVGESILGSFLKQVILDLIEEDIP
jgi:hypothetical protein